MTRRPFFSVVSENFTGGGATADSHAVDAAAQLAATIVSRSRLAEADVMIPSLDLSDACASGRCGGERVEQRRRRRTLQIAERLRGESTRVRDREADAFEVAIARNAGNVTRVTGCRNHPAPSAVDD